MSDKLVKRPRGRPRGAARIAKYISDLTDDGKKIVDFAVRTLDNDLADVRDRQWAASFLMDRLVGKAPVTGTIDISVEHRATIDLSRLSLDELQYVRGVLDKARQQEDVIDVEVKELAE